MKTTIESVKTMDLEGMTHTMHDMQKLAKLYQSRGDLDKCLTLYNALEIMIDAREEISKYWNDKARAVHIADAEQPFRY